MRPRHGFTLIEVIGATAAFVIAFLAGTAAFTRLLHHEMANYHRALAGVAGIRYARSPTALTSFAYPDPMLADLSPHLFIVPDTGTGSADPDKDVTNAAYYCIKVYYGDSSNVTNAVFLSRYHVPPTPDSPKPVK